MSFWKPFLNQFARSLSTPNSKPSQRAKGQKGRSYQARIESLEGRVLLTSVTGDFNGDGIADLAIGIPSQTVNNITNAGGVQILYGTPRTSSFQSGSFDAGLNGLTAKGNQLITQASAGLNSTAQANANFGAALAVGDFNHDGIADLAIGASGENVNGVTGAGAVYILFGSRTTGLKTTGAQLWTEKSLNRPAAAGDHFGAALAAGDFNNDRAIDLAVGVPNKTISGKANAGQVSVIYGAAKGLAVAKNQLWDQSQLNAGSIAAGDLFGSDLVAADFNADGFRDLAVGAPGQMVSGNANAGAVNVIYGRAAGLNALNNQFWTAGSTSAEGNVTAGGKFGSALAAGDLNSDSRMDLVIGAPGENIATSGNPAVDAGAVHIIMGSTTRLTVNASDPLQLITENTTGITNASPATGDNFGAAIAVGSMNGDNVADLAIGAPGAATPNDTTNNISSVSNAGTVSILYGTTAKTTKGTNGAITKTPAGLSSTNAQVFQQNSVSSNNVPVLGHGANSGEQFGASLAIGDFNSDRIGDLAIGVGADVDNNSLAGAANILFGTSSGIDLGGTSTTEVNQFWVPANQQAGDAFLASNKTKSGVITLPDGLEYKVISGPTTGPKPTIGSTATVDYTGTLIDGTPFDSSADHGGPQSFPVNGVVKGFGEALEQMHVGEHIEVWIPSYLAYGMVGQPQSGINPNSVLIFDLTLDSFK